MEAAGSVRSPHALSHEPAKIEAHLDQLQSEINDLKSEINVLRRRDETLNFYMHRLDEELRLAARLQQDFLPKTLPQVGSVHFHTLFRPAGYVSGDLYDVMRLDESHIGFYMADAVGHGVPAALLTMFIKNALVTKHIDPTGYRLLTPVETITRLNELLIQQHLSASTFATAVYGMINVRTHTVTFARGGHPHPILLKPDGITQELIADGGLLGVFPDETFTAATVQLHPGDRLLIYTDGLECAFSESPEDVDPMRWRQEIHRRRQMSTEELMVDLSEHLDRHSGSLAPKDDLTLIIAEVK